MLSNLVEDDCDESAQCNLQRSDKRGSVHTIICSSQPPPARAFALEVGFDYTTAYLTFIDEAVMLLDTEYAGPDHLALGG